MHHANILINKENCKDFVFDILKNDLNFEIKANPDFLLLENESFGIDDARDLGRWALGKPLTSETKVSFIITKSITHEAQNALLKVLEEPILGTYFFINLESGGGLLPTFLSRVNFLENFSGGALEENFLKASLRKENKNDASKFLNSDIKGKFSMIQTLSKMADKTDMKELIKDLEKVAYKNKESVFNGCRADTISLNHVLTAKIFVTVRGSSPKMLLEWLACVI